MNVRILIIVIVLILVCAIVLLENSGRAMNCAQYTAACRANLKCISTALEMYASDHQQAYPCHLNELTPQYLKTIPTCPWAGSETYSAGYDVCNDPANADGRAYTLCCRGINHYHYRDLLPLSSRHPILPVRSDEPAPSFSSKNGLQ